MPCPNDHRRRLITVGFRVTPEQSARINDLVAASGMTKQDYIVKRLQCEEIVVTPSSRVYKALRDRMDLVYRELSRIVDGGCPDERVIALAELLSKEFVGFRTSETSPVPAAEEMLLDMARR